ncbi:hypothetical protein LJC56_08775 [Christensenellaceae bacterium OttesenSCG-928-K19]|nr:hypothetical protein [Christensenellaceae bacterium OttesenSCG-928-K19]
MSNIFEDTLNLGFGLFAYSREKIESFVEKMVDVGKVEKKDAQGITHELIQKGEEQREEIKKYVTDEVKKTTQDMGFSGGLTKEDIRAIVREELDKDKNG